MTRDEAIDLLQVMLLDEREPPGLAPKGLTVRVDQPGTERGPTSTVKADIASRSAEVLAEPGVQRASLHFNVAWPSMRL